MQQSSPSLSYAKQEQTKAEQLLIALHKNRPAGFVLGLERIELLLQRLGNPHLKLPPVIHIAGTNGKGSTTSFCRYLLEEAGYRVHVHTSPHLVHYHERFRLAHRGGGRLVDDETLYETLHHVVCVNKDAPTSVFEIMTAAAFVLFAQYPADAVILEVGLGGRLDATNVIEKPAVSVITPVSSDHEALLGKDVASIAREKAGIIKSGCPVVIGEQPFAQALAVLTQTAKEKHAPIKQFGRDYFAFEEKGGMVFQNGQGLFDLPLPHLSGPHQISNAATAITAVDFAGFPLEPKTIASALVKTQWPARMQKLTEGHLIASLPPGCEIWLDGGHNPGAGLVIAQTLEKMDRGQHKPTFLILGMLATKDAQGYLENFVGRVAGIHCVPISGHQGQSPERLVQIAQGLGLQAKAASDFEEALKAICKENRPPIRILIGGSLYLAGEVLGRNATPPC